MPSRLFFLISCSSNTATVTTCRQEGGASVSLTIPACISSLCEASFAFIRLILHELWKNEPLQGKRMTPP